MCFSPKIDIEIGLELVVGHHNSTSDLHLTTFTKWCPLENGVTSIENAEKAIDLALNRLGQKQIPLLQCKPGLECLYVHNVLM
jgi:hypothetical protein